MDEDEKKKIIKKALQEWLDQKFSEIGRWTLRAVAAALLVGLIYFMLWINGWEKVPIN